MTTTNATILKAIAILSGAGTLFAGYLSWSALFATSCAFGETCQYLLGYPTCLYGFVMYLAIFITALLGVSAAVSAHRALQIITGIAIAGALFAGYFVVEELRSSTVVGGVLGLSTCAYGLIFYVLVLLLSTRGLRRRAL